MTRVGFEPTTPVFQRAKMVHALDRLAPMIGLQIYTEAKQLKLFLLNRSTVFSVKQ
jgi:hypothetical protein